MAQAGGGLVEDGQAVAEQPGERRGPRLREGAARRPAPSRTRQDLGAGWGGEAFGKQLAAMAIEGNWIAGAMTNDFPDVEYTVAELPAGPAGQGTLQFTNCWGMAADSPNQEAALDLVEFLTSTEQQLAFSQAFGVDAVDPVGRRPVERATTPTSPRSSAEPTTPRASPTQDGAAEVIADFNSAAPGPEDGRSAGRSSTRPGEPRGIVG